MDYRDVRLHRGHDVDIASRAVRIAQGLPLVDAREFAAVHTGDRLEGDSV
jgi:hypothetical protein